MRSLGLGLGLGRGCLVGAAPQEPAPTNTYFTDFSDAAAFVGERGVHHTASSGQRALSPDAVSDFTDGEVLVLVTSANLSTDTRLGAYIRGGGDVGSETAYEAEFTGGGGANELQLWRFDGGSFSSLGSASKYPAEGERWYIRLRADGTAIKVKAWKQSADEPAAWDIEVTDANISGAGFPALRGRGDNYYDYFAVDTDGGTAPLPDETPGANQYATDFSGQTADAAPSGWTEEWDTSSSTWTVVDEGASPLDWAVRQNGRPWQLAADASTEGGKLITCTPASDALGILSADAADDLDGRADAEIVARMQAVGSIATGLNAGIAVRVSSGDSYWLGVASSTSIRLMRQTAGIESAAMVSVDFANPFWMRFRINGDTLQGRAWQDGDPEPATWDTTTTDLNITDAGWIGLVIYQDQAWTWDVVGIATDGATAPTS